MQSPAQLSLLVDDHIDEDPAFLQEQIITYIGNKRALLPFIGSALQTVKQDLGRDKLRVVDLFSGSGVVARYFKQHAEHIVANDLETYSRVSNECFLSNASELDREALTELCHRLHHEVESRLAPGFITRLYAPNDELAIQPTDRVFYTRRNAMYLDTARQLVDTAPARFRPLLLAPLLAKASVHANTSGVFKGFYKGKHGSGQFGGHGRDALTRILGDIRLTPPVLSRFECSVEVRQQDANILVKSLDPVDVAYIDPPYNQHPYGSNYFMLNLLAEYREPSEISTVSGIPVDWNRSRYNQRAEAETALLELVDACPAKYLLISYNSEGFVSHDRFVHALQHLGQLTVMQTAYNTFRGSRNLRDRPIHVTEFLYLLKKI
jgi:adenine-specific DNA-methyltransferase